MSTLEEMFTDCTVTHIGQDAIKDGDLLVLDVNFVPTTSEFSRMLDYAREETRKSGLSVPVMIWPELNDVTLRSREEITALRDTLIRFLEDKA